MAAICSEELYADLGLDSGTPLDVGIHGVRRNAHGHTSAQRLSQPRKPAHALYNSLLCTQEIQTTI